MRITVLRAGHIGSTVGRLWHATGHEVTFAAQDSTGAHALAEQRGERAHAAAVAEAVAAAEVVLVAIPGPAVVDALTAAGSLDGQVVIDAANTMGKDRLSLRQLANTFPRARWVRACNTLQARVLANEHHRQPRWVLFLSGDEKGEIVKTCGLHVTLLEPCLLICRVVPTRWPLAKRAPTRTRAKRWGAFTARHRAWAASTSLNAIARPAACGRRVTPCACGPFTPTRLGTIRSPSCVEV
jgi:predicted dinucleotide-binding enzyme